MPVRRVDAIPLRYPLDEGDEYGSVRGVVRDRVSVLVRLETDDGSVGWGESFGPPESVSTIVDELLADFVVGTDPVEVTSLSERLYSGPYHFSRSGLFQCAASGVDIALWDLYGKLVDRSVCSLLGGASGRTVQPYASTSMHTEDDRRKLEAALEQAVDEGFSAAKIKVGRGLENDVERVETARDILGTDARLMLDVNGNYQASQATALARAVEPYDITWLEEPVPPTDLDGYREVRSNSSIPVAGGEAAFGRFEFERLLSERRVDIAMPDVSMSGGVSEAMKIADLATTENLAVSPHVWMGAIGLVASLHFAHALPTYPHSRHYPEPVLFEVDRAENPLRDDLLVDELTLNGEHVPAPDGLGLGIEPDEATIERYRIDE